MAGLQLPLPPSTCHSVGPLANSGVQGQFSFTTNSDGTSVTITGYTGGGGALTHSPTLGGLLVTGIGTERVAACGAMTAVTLPDSDRQHRRRRALQCHCFTLTNISIPDSVTSIGTILSAPASNWTAINVDTNNPAYVSVGGVLFNKEPNRAHSISGWTGQKLHNSQRRHYHRRRCLRLLPKPPEEA